jgi:hypothetical protein
MGKKVRFHVDVSAIGQGRIAPDKRRPTSRMGGIDHMRTTGRFSTTRPKV